MIRKQQKESTQQELVRVLWEQGKKISFAESCTAGSAASALVAVPGASEVFELSFVTYCDKAKHKLLDVKKKTLKKHGAVSAQCAHEMAKGCRKASASDLAISITGFAGPDGGTEENPVGTVYIGCSVKKKTIVQKYNFSGDREHVRRQAVQEAHTFALKVLKENTKHQKKAKEFK